MPLLICLRNWLSKLFFKNERTGAARPFLSPLVTPRPPTSAPKPPPPPEIIGAFDVRRDAHSDATPHGAECDVPLWRNMKMYIELPRRPIYDGGEQGVWGWRGVCRAVRGGRPPRLSAQADSFLFVSLRDVRCASSLGASGGSPAPRFP